MDMARSLEIARSLSPDQISTALLKRLHGRSGIHSRGWSASCTGFDAPGFDQADP